MRNKLSLVLPRSKAGAGEVAFTVADAAARYLAAAISLPSR